MQPLAIGTGLTERERHARELAAKALSLGVTSRATADDGLLDELCEWLRTEPALNEEVVQAALPKLRAEQVPLRWWVDGRGVCYGPTAVAAAYSVVLGMPLRW